MITKILSAIIFAGLALPAVADTNTASVTKTPGHDGTQITVQMQTPVATDKNVPNLSSSSGQSQQSGTVNVQTCLNGCFIIDP